MSDRAYASPGWLSAGFMGLFLLGFSWFTLFLGLKGVATFLDAFRVLAWEGLLFGLLVPAAGAWLWSFFAAYLGNALSWNIRIGPDHVNFREGLRRCNIAAEDLRKLSFCAISPQGWRYITLVAGAEPCAITNALYSSKTFDALSADVRRWAADHGKTDCIVEDIPPGNLGAKYRRRGRLAYLAIYIVALVLAGLILAAVRGVPFPGVGSAIVSA